MDTFYCPPSGISGDSLIIGGEEFSHLAHVMRKREGDTLMVVDGRGNGYEAVISRIERRSAHCGISAKHTGYREPYRRVTLGAGVLKNPSKFDFLVEKATELGVVEVVPLKTERTIPSRSKSERWRKLTLAAMKQCGRSLWPEVRELTALGVLLKEPDRYDLKLVAHERMPAGEAGKAKDWLRGPGGKVPARRNILMLVGPEGGFSEDEIALCLGAGFEPVWLGERRLRTETAAIASLALLMR